ncbi:hypothetical protein BGZ58_004629 [Dissophora ornata]|nr:hypothetical protein BGZ58_004629 [Dissophora ornata]
MALNVLSSRRSRRVCPVLSVFICVLLLVTSLHSLEIIDLRVYSGLYDVDSTKKPILEQNNHWRGRTVIQEIEVPDATWTCTDDGQSEEEKELKKNRRSRQCVVQNLCVDRKGAFIRNSGRFLYRNLPKVNLMSSDEDSDVFWEPRVEQSRSKMMNAHYVDETLFVHGLYSPFHFSHWLYNGMMPLYSTMKRFNGTKHSWTFRGARFARDDIKRQGAWEMGHIFQSGLELVLSQYELSTDFQSLPPSDAPICFRRAVIGLGSQCALNYCENNIPAEVYQSFQDEVADYYWRTPQTWERHLAVAQESIIAKLRSQQGTGQDLNQVSKTQNSPLRCLDLARYYNFEKAGGRELSQEEKESRVGQRFPDAVDREADHPKTTPLDANTDPNQTEGSRRKLVVGIIQRENSRRLINDQELIDGLVAAGFRIKWMTFDHGCGLAETAYLLRDINVLISPHGNAIGTSIFMPTHNPVPTLVSVDPSRRSEAWFMFTATAMGQRFIQTSCGPDAYADEATKERCPFYKDLASGLKLLQNRNLVLGLPEAMVKSDKEKATSGQDLERMRTRLQQYVKSTPAAQALAKEEMELLIGPELPVPLIQKYGEDVWSFLDDFWKGIPRYVDVPRIVTFVQDLQSDLEREQEVALRANSTVGAASLSYEQYIDYVRKGQACGVQPCEEILQRNVALDTSAFGQYSVNNVAMWGQQRPDSKTLRQELTDLKSWKFAP